MLTLAAAVLTVSCNVITVCEEMAIATCGKSYISAGLRGPYPDGHFELDYICGKNT